MKFFYALIVCVSLSIISTAATAEINGDYVYFDDNGNLMDIEYPKRSIAREWIDATLEAIQFDVPRPTVHARNLFNLSAAMWDSWAAYDTNVRGYVYTDKIKDISSEDLEDARAKTLNYAAYRILTHRYGFKYAQSKPTESKVVNATFDNLLLEMGLDKDNKSMDVNDPIGLGNHIAKLYIDRGLEDGAREWDNYNNESYRSVNGVLLPIVEGSSNLKDPNRWQPIAMNARMLDGGKVSVGKDRIFLGAEWGDVVPFALSENDVTTYERDGKTYKVYHDPGPPPYTGTPSGTAYNWNFELVAVWSSHLDPEQTKVIDISPSLIGNVVLPTDPDNFERFYDYFGGGDKTSGYSKNPVTGKKYRRQFVKQADYARATAEFWADGLGSETPAGHWYRFLNYVNDHPQLERRWGGEGEELSQLEWDIKTYFVLGAAVHDAAIAAWSVKGWYDYVRPMSAIRYLSSLGQGSDPAKPSYHKDGINLIPGYIELITEKSSADGQRHAHLRDHIGEIALKAWRGPDFIDNKYYDNAGVGWILGTKWWPYQRSDFITPPFAGYVSGHSTYSSASAEILTRITGSKYFPNGLGGFSCPKDTCFVFERGPTEDVYLQWASYYDAANESALSRIWGGIHPPADDMAGRLIGLKVGKDSYQKAVGYWR